MKTKEPKIQHLAIIMDGNRRWALQRGLPVAKGHRSGVEALERIVKAVSRMKIKFLTVYALSTENLKEREKNEIRNLFKILREGFIQKLPTLKKEKVKVKFFGDKEGLPKLVQGILTETEKTLSAGTALQLNIAINYGSRAELVNAFKKLNGKPISEETITEHLYTVGLVDPDLIIRTGGHKRLSNFLLWQAAYSELYFTDTPWPDFTETELKEIIQDFENRKRNFGR